MKHLRYWSLATFVFVLLLLSARACGPDFPSAVFVLPENPDSYKAFVQGHLEVLQPGFHTRHLVVAYRYLSGQPLSAEEQKEAASANDYFVDPNRDGGRYSDKPLPGFDAWIKTRNYFGPVDGFSPDGTLATSRSVPGGDYDDFTNCLDPAFATAAATLNALIQQHGAKDPAVNEWVRGQDAVFQQCGDPNPPRYFGPGQPPPPKPAPALPTAAPANAPLWLKQDRAYQLAAAHFYAVDFDAALAGFQAIAADTASPWSVTARYLEARALIRKAALTPMPPRAATGTPMTGEQRKAAVQEQNKRFEAARARTQKTLRQAQQVLLEARNEPRMAPMRNAIDDLLDYIGVRLAPRAQSIALAHRMITPDNPRLRQSLIDFTVLHTSADEGNDILAITEPLDHATPSPSQDRETDRAASDLVVWIEALNASTSVALFNRDPKADAAATALTHWRSTHTTVWLAAALMLTQQPGPETPALLAAAKAVPTSDPAYLTITYHRLRLSPHDAATQNGITALLPQVRKSDGTSAINQFTALAAASAPSLDAWLKTAARTPAGSSFFSELDVAPPTPPQGDVCGRKPTTYSLFDTDAAVTFNQQMPLRLLAAAAESTTLPENLRLQVAQAAWARAVLLDKPGIAHRMSPILIACRPTWKPVLDDYDAATSPSDKHATGLLALMRFASTEPSVRDGEERRSGFATYDVMRQNWWCSTVPLPTETVDSQPASWYPNRDPDSPYGSDPASMATHPHVAPPPPPFLTATDLAEAKTEAATLRTVPNASTYFAQQALAWFHQHPSDPRTPDILGEADRVVRNSCRNDPAYGTQPGPENTVTFAHALFDALHQHYPNSPWAKRYTTWE